MIDKSTVGLISELELANARYDFWLAESFARARETGKKTQTEEEIRLTARQSLRKEGYREPEVIRWDLRATISNTFEV